MMIDRYITKNIANFNVYNKIPIKLKGWIILKNHIKLSIVKLISLNAYFCIILQQTILSNNKNYEK